MTLSNSKAVTDAAAFSLIQVDACTRNVDTGRVDIILSQGAGKPSLTLAIKDYSSTAKAYSCLQAADNQTSETDVGGKFESCAVGAKVLSSATATSLNGYAMYRETVATKKFAFAGSCKITVTTASPSIKGTVSCDGLVQTLLEGAARNPLEGAPTASLNADFSCNF